MNTGRYDETPLFLMRFWGDDDGDPAIASSRSGLGAQDAAQRKWCGKLLRVSTGEARYFSGLPDLLAVLDSMLGGATAEDHPPITISGHD
jgi:hypothetical protein